MIYWNVGTAFQRGLKLVANRNNFTENLAKKDTTIAPCPHYFYKVFTGIYFNASSHRYKSAMSWSLILLGG